MADLAAGGRRAPVGVNAGVANAARISDYLLGGKDNYAIDQAVAHRWLAIAPDLRTLAWFGRRFLVHAVELAVAAGVRQFVDLGAGIPNSPSTHEVARQRDPAARIAYVDHDPLVFAHTNALVNKLPGVSVLLGDVRWPGDVIERLRADAGIDFGEPVAVLLNGVMHFVMDDEHPADTVAAFREVMAPGSFLALTHASDRTHPDLMDQMVADTVGSPAQIVFRSDAAIAALTRGFHTIAPGLAPVQQWLGRDLPATRLVLLGGVCRK